MTLSHPIFQVKTTIRVDHLFFDRSFLVHDAFPGLEDMAGEGHLEVTEFGSVPN